MSKQMGVNLKLSDHSNQKGSFISHRLTLLSQEFEKNIISCVENLLIQYIYWFLINISEHTKQYKILPFSKAQYWPKSNKNSTVLAAV